MYTVNIYYDVLDAADVLKRGSVDWEGQTLTMKKPNPLRPFGNVIFFGRILEESNKCI